MHDTEMGAVEAVNEWDEVLDFWFPEESLSIVDERVHAEHWFWRMRGGADNEIIARFSDLTDRAARGELEHWALYPHGRLALIIILDQFSRSVWRDNIRSYTQDLHALSLTMEGLSNGHYIAFETSWFKVVFGLPLGHCEGPDHLQQIDLLIRLREEIAATTQLRLKPIYLSLVKQARVVREIIAAFGRHPHRNAILSRKSSEAEEAYITEGKFPHLRAFQK